mgnify:FL=1
MKSFALQTSVDNFEAELQSWADKDIQLAILFSSKDIIKNGDVLKKFKSILPNTELVGCSSSGEIGEGVEDDSISLIGVKFETTKFKCVNTTITDATQSKKCGQELANSLMGDDLKAVFVLSPGLNVNGSQLTEGLREVLPMHVSVSGGLAGDGVAFEDTCTLHNEDMFENKAIAVGFYGDAVRVTTGSRGGWKPFGPLRRVTKVENNVLYELDGKPALDLYKEYLGEKANELPASGLLYPFAIMDENNQDTTGLVRTILDIDEENNSLILAGDLEEGNMVCLMHANTDELVSGAEEAAKATFQTSEQSEDAAIICISCVGRKLVIGDDTEEELDAVREVFGTNSVIAGFYSYGEISHFQDTGKPELHNQTMTITCISEG